MSTRLWYPQLDVFDAARRISVLLQYFESPPGLERLYIVDFFLANPPLLHRTTMSTDVRRKFNELRIPKPDKTFLSYPSAPLLFHKMEEIQKEAVSALSGKGLISNEEFKNGRVKLTTQGKALFPVNAMCSNDEAELGKFLVSHFAAREEIGNNDLRRRTGLRRPV